MLRIVNERTIQQKMIDMSPDRHHAVLYLTASFMNKQAVKCGILVWETLIFNTNSHEHTIHVNHMLPTNFLVSRRASQEY